MCDCLGDLKKTNKDFRVKITSHVIDQSNNLYLQSPSFNLLHQRILPFHLIAYIVLLIFVVVASRGTIEYDHIHSDDFPFLFLLSTIGMQIIAILFIYAHTWIFTWNGRGFWILDMFGHCWLMAGDSCCFFLIILLVRGWGTKFVNFPKSFNNSILMVGAMIVSRYIWTIFGWYFRGGSEDGGEYIFDGVPGMFELLIGLTKYSIYLVVWWMGYLKTGPQRGLETKYWRRLDNWLFIAAFIAVIVRAIAILSIEKFEEAYHESLGLFVSLICNFTMMVILSILMAPKNSPYMKLAKSQEHINALE